MGKPKLEMTGWLVESECKARCVWIDCKRHRRLMTRLRGGTAELGIANYGNPYLQDCDLLMGKYLPHHTLWF